MSALRGSSGSGERRGAGKRRGPASKTTKLRAALRATEQKYRQLVQSANSIIMRRDVEGRVTFFNEFAQQFFGYSEDEILGRHVIGTILPKRDSAGRDMAEMIREINEHPEWYTNNQNENVRRGGERVWVAWTNRPIFDDDGKLVEILAVGNDISDRKRAEDALRESDDRLRSLLRSLNVGVYRTTGDSDGRFLEANPAMARILGYDSVAELMTVRVCDLYPRPADRITSLSDTAARPGGRVKDKELRLRRKDGELIWASITSQITLDENGGIRWVDGVMEDVTERRGIAEELRRAKDRAQRYLDVAAVMIVAMDGEGRVTLANRRTCEVLGYADEEALIGRVWFDRFLPDELRERAKRALGRLMSGDLTAMKPKVAPLLTRGGQEHVISWRSVPIRDDDGKIVGVVSSGTDVTDLKLAEEALHTSEERYRRVFENAQEGISVHELTDDGRKLLVDCNDRYAETSGFTREELFSTGDVRQLQRSLDPPEERKRILTLAAALQPHSGGYAWQRPDGRENFFENTTSYFQAAGRTFAVAVDRDVSEERAAEDALRSSEARYRGVYDTAPLAFVLWDAKCLVTDWNRRAEEVFGWRRKEVLGRNFFEFLVPESSRPEMEEVVAALLRGEVARNLVNENLTKSGRTITCEWSNAVLFDKRSHVEGVISLALDVTDRVRIEEALRDSEARYRMVFENAHEGISVHEMLPGGGKRLIDCNDRYVQISGYSREELMEIGDVTSLQVSRLSEDEEERIRSSAGEAAAHSGSMSWKRPDGRENFIEYTCGFLETGGRRFAVGIDRDVTERRRARRETRVLEERLRQGEKMQAIGELAGGVAHDFNNQLAAIMGCAEMLQRKLADDGLARYADIIVQACARAADVTGQLLAFARKGKVRTAPVNVHAVVDEVVALLEHSIDKRIRVRRRLNAAAPTVMGDPTQLQNALLNIAINARDAMPEGGYLTFSSEDALLGEAEVLALPYEMDPGRYLRVSVSDTGVGMDARTRKHIFEPFFTTKEVGKGTGMGLAAVYGTVKSHHGAIEVESAPGKGSTFTVLLPVGAPEQDDSASEDELPRSGRAARVLVVDDEELVREAAAGMLGVLGYEAIPCATGKQALELYSERWREIDLVLLDMVMPVMNGTETFKALRGVNPGVKVVLSSGYSLDGEAQTLLEEGVVSFVQKPYRAADLAAHLGEALES